MCLLQIQGWIQLLCNGTLILKAVYGKAIVVSGNYIVIKIIAHVFLWYYNILGHLSQSISAELQLQYNLHSRPVHAL